MFDVFDAKENREDIFKVMSTVSLLVFLKVLLDKKSRTRRDFLKVGGMALATGVMHVYANIDLWVDEYQSKVYESGNEFEQKLRRFATSSIEVLSPDANEIALTMRNFLMAEKISGLQKSYFQDPNHKEEIIEKPKIGIVIGASHTGIENALQTSQDKRLTLLRGFLMREELSNELYTAGQTSFISWDSAGEMHGNFVVNSKLVEMGAKLKK